jgi:hypothetical protein
MFEPCPELPPTSQRFYYSRLVHKDLAVRGIFAMADGRRPELSVSHERQAAAQIRFGIQDVIVAGLPSGHIGIEHRAKPVKARFQSTAQIWKSVSQLRLSLVNPDGQYAGSKLLKVIRNSEKEYILTSAMNHLFQHTNELRQPRTAREHKLICREAPRRRSTT